MFLFFADWWEAYQARPTPARTSPPGARLPPVRCRSRTTWPRWARCATSRRGSAPAPTGWTGCRTCRRTPTCRWRPARRRSPRPGSTSTTRGWTHGLGRGEGPRGRRRADPDRGAAGRLRADAGPVGRGPPVHAGHHGGQPAADPPADRRRDRQLLRDAAGRDRPGPGADLHRAGPGPAGPAAPRPGPPPLLRHRGAARAGPPRPRRRRADAVHVQQRHRLPARRRGRLGAGAVRARGLHLQPDPAGVAERVRVRAARRRDRAGRRGAAGCSPTG